MTWNVWGRFGERWLRRERAIVETVRAQRPELVALQETWRVDDMSQPGQLGAELGMSSAFAASRMPHDPHPGVRLGLGILSRYPLQRVEAHELTAQTIALRGEVRMGDRRLHFITSCLDWEQDHDAERREQAEKLAALVSRLTAAGDEVVVAADLNLPPDRPELAPLRAVLADSWQRSGGITYSSANQYLGHGEWLEDNRIDYILASSRPRRSTLVGYDEDHGRPPSDHYAVVTDVPLA